MNKLIVIGGGGFGREVLWLAEDVGRSILGILDDHSEVGSHVAGYAVLGAIEDWILYPEADFLIAVGSPEKRESICCRMKKHVEPNFATLVHPSVAMSKRVDIGAGSIICAGCTLTVDIKLGRHNILNINSTVGHDVETGDFVTVAPIVAISGNVILEDRVEVGTGASIRQGLTMGKDSMLGMGGVLTKSVEPGMLFLGNPARPLRRLVK